MGDHGRGIGHMSQLHDLFEWVRAREIPSTANHVLMALALRADTQTYVVKWVSIGRLCRDTKLARSTVIRALNLLRKNEFILAEQRFATPGKGKRGQRPNRYVLQVDRGVIETPLSDFRGVTETRGKCHRDTRTALSTAEEFKNSGENDGTKVKPCLLRERSILHDAAGQEIR